MTDTKEQAAAMIAYLFQVMFERGEILRKDRTGSKEAERHANIIHSLARSIAILREDYGLYDRIAAQADAQPAEPATESPDWDSEQQGEGHDYTPEEPEEEPTE